MSCDVSETKYLLPAVFACVFVCVCGRGGGGGGGGGRVVILQIVNSGGQFTQLTPQTKLSVAGVHARLPLEQFKSSASCLTPCQLSNNSRCSRIIIYKVSEWKHCCVMAIAIYFHI